MKIPLPALVALVLIISSLSYFFGWTERQTIAWFGLLFAAYIGALFSKTP